MPANMVKKEPQGSGGNKERLTNAGEHGKKKGAARLRWN